MAENNYKKYWLCKKKFGYYRTIEKMKSLIKVSSQVSRGSEIDFQNNIFPITIILNKLCHVLKRKVFNNKSAVNYIIYLTLI